MKVILHRDIISKDIGSFIDLSCKEPYYISISNSWTFSSLPKETLAVIFYDKGDPDLGQGMPISAFRRLLKDGVITILE